MPWKETRPVDERVRFIAAINESDETFAALCRRFGISRKTGYKWAARFEELGPSGLDARPPVAQTCPHRVADDVTDVIVTLRKERPTWGPKKLRELLLTRGIASPAASTIGDILKRNGLIRPRRRRVRVPIHLEPMSLGEHPNDVWCVDFKGHFALGDRTRCHPLTLTDHASRYVLLCEGMHEPKGDVVQQQLDRAFREFGMPARLRSDNGPPFASTGVGGLSALSVHCIKLGVTPERIEPGQPQQNGRHERMHKTLKQETASPPAATLVDQQRSFDRFRHDFNDVRPHEALAMKTPSSRYTPSRRVRPSKPTSPEYSDSMKTRRLDENGRLHFNNGKILVTRLLAGEPVGLEEVDEDIYELHYGPVLLGEIHVRGKELRLERVG